METTFKNKKFQKTCNSEKNLLKEYGKNCARKIRARLDDLQAALNLEHPLRLIFEPSNEDINKKDDDGMD